MATLQALLLVANFEIQSIMFNLSWPPRTKLA